MFELDLGKSRIQILSENSFRILCNPSGNLIESFQNHFRIIPQSFRNHFKILSILFFQVRKYQVRCQICFKTLLWKSGYAPWGRLLVLCPRPFRRGCNCCFGTIDFRSVHVWLSKFYLNFILILSKFHSGKIRIKFG